MSTLIIDAGSTKMEWALLEKGKVADRFTTPGFNPNYTPFTVLQDALKRDFPVVDSVYYYGTGCGSEKNCQLIRECFQERFPQAEVFVSHDLMGAARALLGHGKGIVCILGTGANSCLYDGEVVVDKAVSLGYLVGDEGSGCYIGRKLAKAYFYDFMPLELKLEFDKSYHLEINEFIDRVYHQKEPSRYLAGFAEFAGEHMDHPFIKTLLKECFMDFIKVFVLRYKECRDLPVCFVGSVAFYCQTLLYECLSDEGLTMGKVMRSPMEGLIQNSALIH